MKRDVNAARFEMRESDFFIIARGVPIQKWDESKHPRDKEGQFAEKPSLEERYPVEPHPGGFAVKLPGGGLIAVTKALGKDRPNSWVIGGQPHYYATPEDAILDARLLAASREPKPKPVFKSHTAEEAEQVIAQAKAEGKRVLFHSGDASIAADLAEGIQPQMGGWVQEVLGGATDDDEAIRQIVDDPDNEIAYYSETPEWVSMKASRMIEGRHVTEITPEELEQHGHLSVVVVDPDDEDLLTSDENQMVYRLGSDEVRRESIPFGVEPGDIYTHSALVPDVTLTGKELLRFLHRNYPESNLLQGTLAAFKWDEAKQKREYVREPAGSPKGGEFAQTRQGARAAIMEVIDDRPVGVDDHPVAIRAAHEVADKLREMKARGYPMPSEVIVEAQQGRKTPGGEAWNNGTIAIRVPDNLPPEISLDEAMAIRSGLPSPKIPDDVDQSLPKFASQKFGDVVVHEMGHVLRRRTIPHPYLTVRSTPEEHAQVAAAQEQFAKEMAAVKHERLTAAANTISQYAHTNPDEFVAEAFTILYNGGTLPPDTLAVYDGLRGAKIL